MLRAIIIDDEAPMRQSLETMLKTLCPNVKLVAKADSVKTGIDAIKNHHPDLVFLDIKMGDGTGFDLLKQLDQVDFKVIFITAYDQYAIKAFKFSALDYLLKPVDPDELVAAVNKTEKLLVQELNKQLGALEDNMQSDSSSGIKIILKTFESIHLLNTRDIVYCESDDGYTIFHLLNGNKILVSNSLKEYDEMLREYGFFRPHRSFLINLIHISRFDKSEGGSIVLSNESKVPVASRRRESLLELFDRISTGN
ncbi:LytR/AlgR family response regulator transcription factor [Bacteroidota bacterium]